MSTDVFDLYVQQSLEKLESLWQRSNIISNSENELSPQRQLLQESLAELSTSIEKLQLACETLRQQNEHLLANRQNLALEKQYYRQLFDSAPDCYIITTKDGTITEFNQKSSELLKVAPQYLIRKSLAVFIALNDRKEYYSQLNQLKRGEIFEATWQLEIIDRQQNTIAVEFMVNTISDRTGQANELCWRINPIKSDFQPNSSASFASTFIDSLRFPIYNLTVQIEEIQADNQAKQLPKKHRWQVIYQQFFGLQSVIDNGYILNNISRERDLNLSLIDYSIFISYVVRQVTFYSNLKLQIIIDNGKLALVGICDVLLLKQMLTNILGIGSETISDHSAIQIKLRKQSDKLVIKIRFLVNVQNLETLTTIFSPLLNSNRFEISSEINMRCAVIQKCLLILQGVIELDWQDETNTNITITIKLPLVAINYRLIK